MAAKKTTKVTETKATEVKAPKTNTKAPKTKETKAPKNEEKKNVVLTVSIDEVAKMYEEAGIKNYNPTAKGNYRIMGSKSGSSLNLRKTQYIIFSTDVDYEALKKAKIEGVELIEKGNSQDKSRPHKVVIQALDTLKKALKVYASNPVNQIVKA
jgi:hypothetical protein